MYSALTLMLLNLGCKQPGERPSATNSDTALQDSGDPDCSYLEDGPALYCSSDGGGGISAPDGEKIEHQGVSFWLIAPEGAGEAPALTLFMLKSGVEGMDAMTQNFIQGIFPVLRQSQPEGYMYLLDTVIVVFEGRYLTGASEPETTAQEMATVLDYVREQYDIDNDKTYFLSESAGTEEGLSFAFHLRQSWLAAYWANDVNTRDVPAKSADELGFAPHGNAGPGGDFPDANAIIDGMREAGYRLPSDAPYSGPGADEHGASKQFSSALLFFDGVSRLE